MDEPVFASLHSLLEVLDIFVVLAGIGFACAAIPQYVARFRSASSVVGPKPPANLRAFHVHGSALHVRDAVQEFARKFGYTVPYADQLRGLLVVAEKPKGLYFPGMFYSVFLNQPSPDQTLVSIGCHSPLAGFVIPGTYPPPNSRWQNNFMHQLAGELVSASHPSAPKFAVPPVNPVPAPDKKLAEEMAMKVAPLLWVVRVGAAAFILLTASVFIESLLPPAHDTLEVTGKKSWATSSRSSGRVDHYLLLTSSPRWPEHYTNADVFEHVQKGDKLDLTLAPWSLKWIQVTALRNGQVFYDWHRTTQGTISLVVLRLFGVIGGALFLYASYRESRAVKRQS